MPYKDKLTQVAYAREYRTRPEAKERHKLRQLTRIRPRDPKSPVACSLCGKERQLSKTQISYIEKGKSKNICRQCAIPLIHSRNSNRTITWGSKIREAQMRPEYRLRRAVPFICGGCGKEGSGYVKHQRYCSKKCQYDARSNDPVKKKAFVFAANLRMGKGKLALLVEMLKNALNKPCEYCNVLLTIENCSIDHKTPYGDSKIRRYATSTVKRHFDQPSNLHIVCYPCNQLKGELDDLQFKTLLNFLLQHPSIGTYVRNRIARGNLMWKYKVKAGYPRNG